MTTLHKAWQKNSGAGAIRNLQHKKVLCCVLNAAQGFFHFWRFCAAYSMPCTQGTPLHFMESDDNQPSRKGSHETAHWLHCAVNHGMMQSIRANGRNFTNQASIVFSRPISRQLCPRSSGNPVRLESVHSFICKTVLAKTAGVKSILMTGGRKCLPPFLTDRIDLCAI